MAKENKESELATNGQHRAQRVRAINSAILAGSYKDNRDVIPMFRTVAFYGASIDSVCPCYADNSQEHPSIKDANMAWKEQSGWMLNPSLSQPTARADETCPPQTTEVFQSRKKRTGVPPSHAVIVARPYCSPEYSPDFYKSGSTLHPSTCGTMSRIKADNSTKTRMPCVEKKRLLDRREEIQAVKQLDEWKPAVDAFMAALEGLDDKAN